MIVMLLAGVAVGAGIALALAGLRAPAPHLASAISHLTADGGQLGGVPHARAAARARVVDAVAVRLGLDRHVSDLTLIGSTPARMVVAKLAYATLGLAFPCVLVAILGVAGLSLPLAIPLLASLCLATALSFLPEVDVRRRARTARQDMRRTVCVFLELVALERSADAGAVEALERAADIGASSGFGHIRDALLRARLEGRTPWQQLSALSDQLNVPELGDVAEIMRLSGEDGASVVATLRARAASLRMHLLQSDVAAANEASERMSIPVALLSIAFIALLGFPAMWRIVFG